jgi:hypothetical protein
MAPDMPDGYKSGYNYVFRRKGTVTERTHFGDLQPWHFMGRAGLDTPNQVKGRAIDFIMKNVEMYRGEGSGVSRDKRDSHLGAALHTIQDSFSAAHVSRDQKTGAISMVQDYSLQDEDLHSGADKKNDITSSAYKTAISTSRDFFVGSG